MKHIIHEAPGYKLEAEITTHPITGPTLELFSTHPKANHPFAQRSLCLTLPRESFARLAVVLEQLK